MTRKEFNKLPIGRQSDIVWEWGYLITNHKSGNFNTIVFSVENFFVEASVFIPENRTVSIKALEKNEVNADCLKRIKEDKSFFYNMLILRKSYSRGALSLLN